jgi:hypothetical protein
MQGMSGLYFFYTIANIYTLQTEELQRESGVAFHPACFELYRIVSEDTFGAVDMNGLVQLRNI